MNNAVRCSISEACKAGGKACDLATACTRYGREVIQLSRGERMDATQLPTNRLQTLLCGIIAFSGSLPDGRRQIYSLTAPGELVCANPVTGLDCWLEALADTTICDVSPKDERSTESQLEPSIADAVLQAHDARLSAAFRHIVVLGRLNALERVRAFLVDMAARIGRHDGDAVHLTLSLSREDIGDYLGLNAESVSRAFRQIKNSGDVEFVSPTRMCLDRNRMNCEIARIWGSTRPALTVVSA